MASKEEFAGQRLQARIQVQEEQIEKQERLESSLFEQRLLTSKWYKKAKLYERLNQEQTQRIGELEETVLELEQTVGELEQTVEVLKIKKAQAVERKNEYKEQVETLQELRRVRARLDSQDEERYRRRKHGRS